MGTGNRKVPRTRSLERLRYNGNILFDIFLGKIVLSGTDRPA
jgi:hypothetical protein